VTHYLKKIYRVVHFVAEGRVLNGFYSS